MAPPSAAAPAPPRRRVRPPIRFRPRNVLAALAASVVLVVAAVVVVVVVYIGRSAYQAGHQSSPTSAVSGLLDAALHNGDKTAAAKYLCNATVKRQVNALIEQNRRFATTGKTATYSWDAPHVQSRTDTRATVTATVAVKVSRGTDTYPYPDQHWSFGLRNGGGPLGGWHVCSLRITGG